MKPKRYRLKRDLPTFKAGEIFVLENAIEQQGLFRESDDIMAYHQKTLDKFPNILTDWFEEIKAEPLIEDEKAREIIRAWMTKNMVRRLTAYYKWGDGTTLENCGAKITFYDDFGLTNGATYTSEELCGEEIE